MLQVMRQGIFSSPCLKDFNILDIHAKGYRSQRMNIELTDNLTLPTITLQKELIAQGEHTVGNTINLSDEELDDEEGSPEMISGFLQSSQDLYFRRSSLTSVLYSIALVAIRAMQPLYLSMEY